MVGTLAQQTPLGERVTKLRLEHGWSQEHLAHKAGCTLNTISRLESGQHRSPRLGTLRGIAEAFGLKIGDLVD